MYIPGIVQNSLSSSVYTSVNQTNFLNTDAIETYTTAKLYTCSRCGKTFSHLAFLRRHLRTHTGERPYVCNICRKGFSQRENLKVHFRLHTGERPFVCDICKKTFRTKDQLKKHALTHFSNN